MNITDAREEKCRHSSSYSSRENLSAPSAHKSGPYEKLRGFQYVKNKFPNVSDTKTRRVYL